MRFLKYLSVVPVFFIITLLNPLAPATVKAQDSKPVIYIASLCQEQDTVCHAMNDAVVALGHTGNLQVVTHAAGVEDPTGPEIDIQGIPVDTQKSGISFVVLWHKKDIPYELALDFRVTKAPISGDKESIENASDGMMSLASDDIIQFLQLQSQSTPAPAPEKDLDKS